jgi:hypothetical protein
MGYGPSLPEVARQAGGYAGKGETPVLQPTKFVFVAPAKALGLDRRFGCSPSRMRLSNDRT